MNKIMKDALILMVITLAAGLALGYVYDITKGPIAEQEQKAKEKAYQAVFADASEFERIEGEAEVFSYEATEIQETLLAKDESGEILGVVMNITNGEGYGGDIQFAMGVTKEGIINGISILAIDETPGLGMKAKEEAFYGQYTGKTADTIQYTKTGAVNANEIDAISGATITTKAVTNGVNAGIVYFKSLVEGGVISE